MKEPKQRGGIFIDGVSERKVLFSFITVLVALAASERIIDCLTNGTSIADIRLMYWPLSFGFVALLGLNLVAGSFSWLASKIGRLKLMPLLFCGAAYGLSMFLLSPIVTILLDRLFGTEEQFSFTSLPDIYAAKWAVTLPAAAFYYVQVFVLLFVRQRKQLQHNSEKLTLNESQSRLASLSSLQYQLRPHFLFNSLNNVAMMVRKGEKEASVDALVSLSTILSKVMRSDKERMISLQEELDLLEHFITIERLRDDKVSISVDVADGANAAMVPALLLQPIVENAFRFARESGIDEPLVHVNAAIVGRAIQLKVFNSGKGLMGWTLTDSSGIGLVNTIHRLRYIYGTDFSFTTKDLPDGLEIVIEVPANK